MGALKVTDLNPAQPARPASRHRASVRWPWALVIAAWGVALLAVLTNHSYLIDHHYLIEESGLPLLVTLLVFLAAWQVMTIGMMLPSSMPMAYMMVHASRRQQHQRRIQAVFLQAMLSSGPRSLWWPSWLTRRSTDWWIVGPGSLRMTG